MSGGKGGSQTSEVKVPQYIEDAGKANLAKADELAKIGFAPDYGPTTAAFTPMQQAAFQNTANTASAFGMGSPMGQQDIMGGMPAPTQYAGGVSGYSSAPIYEQSVDQLRAARPAQYQALMAPFIDPVTGRQPGAPYQGVSGTEAARAAEAAGQPAPVYNDINYGGLGYGGMSGGNSFQGPNQNGDVGYGVGGYTSFGDRFDRGGPGVKGGAFSGGGAISAAANAATGGDGPGGDKVICTALHELGRLSDEVYALDAQFGLRVNREDPMLGDGYRLWATSVANYIKGDSLGSKLALAIVAPVATAWAAEMAHVMRPDEYKTNLAGKALMAVGHPICRMIGKAFLPKMNKEAV